jgi:TetR/AcrR family transcriptional regulator, mexJK operon transcriptional repressor
MREEDSKSRGNGMDDRELRILEAARDLILDRGYAATSMDEVAGRARVSKTTLYKRFPSKEALFEAVIRWRCSAHGMVFAADSFRDETIEDALTSIAKRFLDLLSSPEAVRVEQVVIGESVRFPEVAGIFLAAAPAQTVETVSAFMAYAMEQGKLQRANPTLMARHFLMIVKAHSKGGDPACPLPMPVPVEETVALFLDGARPR